MAFSSQVGKVLAGPWRAVAILSVTQILAWGAIYYTPVLMVPIIAAERGWSKAFTMGGYSLGILSAGLAARLVGGLIDRYGGHRVMPFGSLLGAAGLIALPYVTSQAAYLAVWVVLGVAMAASLYDPAFASLGRIFGAAARRPITVLTFAGGLASTVSWPATRALIDGVGWQHTYAIYAALLLLIAAPLHAALPRVQAIVAPPPAAAPGSSAPAHFAPRGRAFALVVLAFAVYAFVPSGLLAHLLAMFGRAGIDPQVAVFIGMIFGPCQTLARLGEFTFARNVHPLGVARFAVASLLAAFALLAAFGLTTPVAISVHAAVRHQQRPHHAVPRHRSARAVRRLRLRPHHRSHRGARARHPVGFAAGRRLHRGAHQRPHRGRAVGRRRRHRARLLPDGAAPGVYSALRLTRVNNFWLTNQWSFNRVLERERRLAVALARTGRAFGPDSATSRSRR